MTRADAKRRWFGGIVLATDLLMLIAGVTFLDARLSGARFAVYWMICFILTGIAIFVAVLDARVLQYRARTEHRALVHETLHKIETDAKSRPHSDAE